MISTEDNVPVKLFIAFMHLLWYIRDKLTNQLNKASLSNLEYKDLCEKFTPEPNNQFPVAFVVNLFRTKPNTPEIVGRTDIPIPCARIYFPEIVQEILLSVCLWGCICASIGVLSQPKQLPVLELVKLPVRLTKSCWFLTLLTEMLDAFPFPAKGQKCRR